MIKLKYSTTYLNILNGYEITKSSQQVQFNDLSCEFTNHNMNDLPEKYQEAKIVDIDSIGIEKVIYTGYVNNIVFDEMREKDVEVIINISLLSPMAMATLRTATAVGTYRLLDLIRDIILTPLIDDGFFIQEIDITDRTITTNFICETIEYCMNNLSNKFNFWWFIDENKKIYIRDIQKMFKQKPTYTYDDSNLIPGLESIKPIVSSDDYANVINFKNVRIYEFSRLTFSNESTLENHNPLINKQIANLKKGDVITFNHPVDINKKNIIKSAESMGIYGVRTALYILGKYIDNTTFETYIRINFDSDELEISENIGFEGNTDSKEEFLLIKDSFFSNLVTGFKYNNESRVVKSITKIQSDSILVWNVNKFFNDKAITDKKGKISNTGIIEKTINMHESWKTIQELREIGVSYMEKNSLEKDGTIEVKLDRSNNVKIGNTIYIDKMSIKNTYVITQIRENYRNENDDDFILTCKNANMLDNFIDVFRGEEKQNSSDKVFQTYVTHYVEESVSEKHEVIQ